MDPCHCLTYDLFVINTTFSPTYGQAFPRNLCVPAVPDHFSVKYQINCGIVEKLTRKLQWRFKVMFANSQINYLSLLQRYCNSVAV